MLLSLSLLVVVGGLLYVDDSVAASISGTVRDAGSWLVAWHRMEPLVAAAAFCLLFVLLSALAIPGCSLLALAAGAVFGLWWATLLITLSSALGATLSFLVARRWLRARVERHWPHWRARVEPLIQRNGAMALFSLRMAPVIPFPILNPLMGLTSIGTWTFFWVSALGMVAGSAAFAAVGAGAGQLGGADAPLLAALFAAALLSWAARWAWRCARA